MIEATVAGHTLRPLAAEDAGRVQSLFERCIDYAMLCDGEPPAPDAGARFLLSGPPGHPAHWTAHLGLFTAELEVHGVVEVPTHYPEPGDWFIALLLLDPAARGSGIGGGVVGAVEAAAATAGARRVELAVLEENEAALRFWRGNGYVPVGERPPRRFGRKVHRAIVLEKCFGGSAEASPPG